MNYAAGLRADAPSCAQEAHRYLSSCAWLTADVTATPPNNDEQ